MLRDQMSEMLKRDGYELHSVEYIYSEDGTRLTILLKCTKEVEDAETGTD